MRALPLCLLLLSTLPQCGGAGGAEPKTAAGHEADDDEESDRDDRDDRDAIAEAGDKDDRPRAPSCDDGTCSPCGDGICPSGWYCDENAGGGPACSWLKECAGEPSCACVTRVLGAGCKCREERGGLKVSCG